jgi:prepilin-type N-terminal cleavage/methylation domain-containing protein
MKRGFTLIEIVLVVVLIGILAAFAMTNYVAIKEKALNRQAKGILLLIRAAERNYRMEYNNYYPYPASTVTSMSVINRDLKLSLPVTVSTSWGWLIGVNSIAGSATLTRSGGADSRVWTINFSGDADAICSSGTYCS